MNRLFKKNRSSTDEAVAKLQVPRQEIVDSFVTDAFGVGSPTGLSGDAIDVVRLGSTRRTEDEVVKF